MKRVLHSASLRVMEWFTDLDMDWLPVMNRTGFVASLPLLAAPSTVLSDPETFKILTTFLHI